MDEEIIYIDDSDHEIDTKNQPEEILYIQLGEELSQEDDCVSDDDKNIDTVPPIPEVQDDTNLKKNLSFQEERLYCETTPEVNVILNQVYCCRDFERTNMVYDNQRVEYFKNVSGFTQNASYRDNPVMNNGSQYMSGYYRNPNNPFESRNPDIDYPFATSQNNEGSRYCRECDYGSIPIYPTQKMGSSAFDFNVPANHHYGMEHCDGEMMTLPHLRDGGYDNWGGDFEAEYRYWQNYFTGAQGFEAPNLCLLKQKHMNQNSQNVGNSVQKRTPDAYDDNLQEYSNDLRVRIYRCDSCQYCSVKKEELMKHIKSSHALPNLIQCSFCKHKVKKKNLLRHIHRIHSNNGFKCTICLKKYVRLHAALKHCLNHLEAWTPNELICAFCTTEFTLRKEFNDHLVLKHLLQGTTQCLRCTYQASDLQKLKYHLNECHAIS